MPTRRGFIATGALATSSLISVKSNLALAPPPPPPNFNNFVTAVTAFNTASQSNKPSDWNTLQGLLDKDVVLVTITLNQSWTGIDAVMYYLQKNVSREGEQLLPNYSSLAWPSSTVVTGRGTWVDLDYKGCDPNNPLTTCGTINFMFRFTKSGAIDRMIGTPD